MHPMGTNELIANLHPLKSEADSGFSQIWKIVFFKKKQLKAVINFCKKPHPRYPTVMNAPLKLL